MKKFFAIAFVAASLVACGEKKPAADATPGDTTKPATEVTGGDTTKPAAGGDTTKPAAGGDTAKPADTKAPK